MTRASTLLLAALAGATAVVAPAPVSAQQPDQAVGVPGLRIVGGQSPVIGGNAAGARERALDDAFRQAVDQALAELLDAPTRVAQAKAIKALEGRARSYVRRYRALEEGEQAGVYALKLEAEVDEAALRRAVERWSAPGPSSGAPTAAPAAPGFLLVASGAPEAAALLLAALVSAGARAQLAESSAGGAQATAAILQAAARAALPQVVLVTADAAPEGAIRGTAKVACACHLAARVVSVPSGLPGAELGVASRGFADSDDAARGPCFSRAAAELAAKLVPPGGTAAAAASDLRAVTVDADVVEPAAVVALLKTARAIGAVSSAELRRVTPGHAELRLRTRGTAAALGPALARDGSGGLDLTNLEVAGDVIRLRARLRPAATAASAPPPASP